MIACIIKKLSAAFQKVFGNPPLAAVQAASSRPGGLRSSLVRRLVFLPLLLVLVLLSSCAMLSPGPPPTRLKLAPSMPERVAGRPLDKQIVVAMPLAGRDIDTDNIALIFNGREVRYLSGVRWTSPVPPIVQRALIDALIASNGVRGVSDESAGISAEAKLLADIRQFALRYDDPKGAPTAVISINFSVLNLSNGAIQGTKNISIEVPAAGRDNMALVTACETALSRCLAEVTPWVVQTAGARRK